MCKPTVLPCEIRGCLCARKDAASRNRPARAQQRPRQLVERQRVIPPDPGGLPERPGRRRKLAKLQMNLEKVHDNDAIIAQMRETAEEDLTKVRAAYEVKYRDAKEHRAKAEHRGEQRREQIGAYARDGGQERCKLGDAEGEHDACGKDQDPAGHLEGGG